MRDFGVYIFREDGTHKGATWFQNPTDALVLFAEACRMQEPRVLICDVLDLAVAEAVVGKVTFASWSLLQAQTDQRKILGDIPKDERECTFCKEVFLPSRQPGMGERWEMEQHISGCCSEVCFKAALGKPAPAPVAQEAFPYDDRDQT